MLFIAAKLTNVTQSVCACSKSTIETQDQGLKSVQSYQWRQHSNIQYGEMVKCCSFTNQVAVGSNPVAVT